MSLKTPYYEVNLDTLNENFSKMELALKAHWNNYIIGYSYKTNSLPWIVGYFQKKGCFAEVVSEDEYYLAKTLNGDKNGLIYNGPIKSKDSFMEAIKNNNIVNIDSKREIDWLRELSENSDCKAGIRVNFDIESICPGQSACGFEGGRFGFSYENGELENAICELNSIGVKISGIHLHVSSKTRSVDIYKAVAEKACEINARYNLNLDYVDIGGGFFGGLENKPSFDEYLRAISSILSKEFSPENTKLILEPGMSLIGSTVSYITTVIDVKDTPYNRFVITDGSRTNIDPFMKKESYFYRIDKTDDIRDSHPKQVVCGFTCIENDRLMVLSNQCEIKVGDRIVYDKVGAYTMCLTPLFISYFPAVYINDSGNLYKVRDKWTAKEYIQNCRTD